MGGFYQTSVRRKLIHSYLKAIGLFLGGLCIAALASIGLSLGFFPGEIDWRELVSMPIALFVIGIPLVTVVWLARASWVTVLSGRVKSIAYVDGSQVVQLYDQRTWHPPRVSGKLFRLDPPTPVAIQCDVWGRWRLNYHQEGPQEIRFY